MDTNDKVEGPGVRQYFLKPIYNTQKGKFYTHRGRVGKHYCMKNGHRPEAEAGGIRVQITERKYEYWLNDF